MRARYWHVSHPGSRLLSNADLLHLILRPKSAVEQKDVAFRQQFLDLFFKRRNIGQIQQSPVRLFIDEMETRHMIRSGQSWIRESRCPATQRDKSIEQT